MRIENPRLLFEYFRVYRWYKQGHLPDIGGYMDQAACVTQILEIMDAASNEAYTVQERANEARAQLSNKPIRKL